MKETNLQVDGMTCPSCIRHINSALTKLPGVKQVDVNLREGTVLVAHDDNTPTESVIIEALQKAGYDSRPKAA